jgi:hypothetical protein
MGLILHKGATRLNHDELAAVATPEGTETWRPLGHWDFVGVVEREMSAAGLSVVSREYGIWKDGARFFGILRLAPSGAEAHGGYGAVVGLRNSNDRAFAAGLCMGSQVFVCDNLAFSNEVVIHRQHTKGLLRDLPRLVSAGLSRLVVARQRMGERIGTYRVTTASDAQAHDFFVRCVDRQVLPVTQLPAALHEWRKPRHTEFEPRTVWSLFNAVTEVIKGSNVEALPRRTEALHGLADQFSGMVIA